MALDKKERIGRAAARLFKEKGYTGTSLRDISREAKVNVSSISYYFGTKEALYRELFRRGRRIRNRTRRNRSKMRRSAFSLSEGIRMYPFGI